MNKTYDVAYQHIPSACQECVSVFLYTGPHLNVMCGRHAEGMCHTIWTTLSHCMVMPHMTTAAHSREWTADFSHTAARWKCFPQGEGICVQESSSLQCFISVKLTDVEQQYFI